MKVNQLLDVNVPYQNSKNYGNVLPSTKTVAEYKYLQAFEVECDAAIALISKNKNVKATLHYDTISHNTIYGE